MGNYDIAKKVADQCAKEELLSPDLVGLISSAENISSCLNRELGAYGIVTSVSPDKKAVYIDNEGMSQILNFFEGKSVQPVLTEEQFVRVKITSWPSLPVSTWSSPCTSETG